MSNPVELIIRFALNDGAGEAFDTWAEQQIAAAQAADGVLSYAIHQGAEGTFVQHERYASEQAAGAFAQQRATQREEWNQLARPTELIVLGETSEQFRETLPPFAIVFAPKHHTTG